MALLPTGDPKIERIKDILRFVFFYVVSWIITQMLTQLDIIPISHTLMVWKFAFIIPIRASVHAGLTGLLALIDRVKYLKDKRGLTLGN